MSELMMAGGKKLTPMNADTAYLDEFQASLTHLLTNKQNGAKYFQAVVNDACGQQYTNQVSGAAPPYQRAQEPFRNGTLHQVTGMTRTLLSDRKGHALTYEGDDMCYWKQSGLPVLMAGNVGTACTPGKFDEVVITTCAPHLDPASLPLIPKMSQVSNKCVDTDIPQPYPDTDEPYPFEPCGGHGACCNPLAMPKQMCPGGIPCRSCGGAGNCQCPSTKDRLVI